MNQALFKERFSTLFPALNLMQKLVCLNDCQGTVGGENWAGLGRGYMSMS